MAKYGWSEETEMLFSSSQSAKGVAPICTTESGIVMEVRDVQCLNAQSPMETTESGMVMEARAKQPLNA